MGNNVYVGMNPNDEFSFQGMVGEKSGDARRAQEAIFVQQLKAMRNHTEMRRMFQSGFLKRLTTMTDKIGENPQEIQDENSKVAIAIRELVYMLYVHEKNIYSSKDPEDVKHVELCKEQFARLRSIVGDELFQKFICKSVIFPMGIKEGKMKLYYFDSKKSYDYETAAEIIKYHLGEEYIQQNGELKKDWILNYSSDFIKGLEKAGMISSKEGIHATPEELLSIEKDLKEDAKYLDAKSRISAYFYGVIDGKTLKRLFKIEDLFDERYVSQKMKLDEDQLNEEDFFFVKDSSKKQSIKEHAQMIRDVIDEVKPRLRKETSRLFVGYYTNGIFSLEDMQYYIENGYVNQEVILSQYVNQHKIKSELEGDNEGYIFDDEKMYSLFNQEYLAEQYVNGKITDVHRKYMIAELSKHYEKKERNMNKDIYAAIKKKIAEKELKDEQIVEILTRLYDDRVVTALAVCDYSNEVKELFIKKYEGRDDVIIDFFNNGLIGSEEVIERCDFDIDRIAELINMGMHPSVAATELMSTAEIVRLATRSKLNITCDLSCLRELIDIDKIQELYQPQKSNNAQEQTSARISDALTYDDLDLLVIHKLITEEEAQQINDEYDYNTKIDLLLEVGLIVGDKNGIKVKPDDGDSMYEEKETGYIRISERDKQILFNALDDDALEFELTSDILKHYNLVIFPKLKTAVMEPGEEGLGASYVMNIKLALDQISKGVKADGEEYEDPLKAYSNRLGIRSIPGMQPTPHIANWGENIVRKMRLIHSNLDELMYKDDKTEAARQNHKDRITRAKEQIHQKFTEAKEKKCKKMVDFE